MNLNKYIESLEGNESSNSIQFEEYLSGIFDIELSRKEKLFIFLSLERTGKKIIFIEKNSIRDSILTYLEKKFSFNTLLYIYDNQNTLLEFCKKRYNHKYHRIILIGKNNTNSLKKVNTYLNLSSIVSIEINHSITINQEYINNLVYCFNTKEKNIYTVDNIMISRFHSNYNLKKYQQPFKSFVIDERYLNTNVVYCYGMDKKKLSRLNIKGSYNSIYISEKVILDRVNFDINGHNNKIFIGKNSKIVGKLQIKGNNSYIYIGENTIMTNFESRLFAQENNIYISIGNNCLVSKTLMRTSDSHSILDINTEHRINYADSITVEDDVWIGEDTTILKGTRIPKGSILAHSSVVSKKFNEYNSIYAGIPAKKIKSNIKWIGERL